MKTSILAACNFFLRSGITQLFVYAVVATIIFFALIPASTARGDEAILWHHNTDGRVYAMTTDGTSVTGGAYVYREPDTAWSIAGQGDFNGDGVRDVVWWNSKSGEVYLQFMRDATNVQSGALIYREANTAWRIVATGDLDGDGKTDLVWWNNQTGEVYAMRIDGSSIAGGALIWVEPDTQWKIVAVGDTDGNATADLIWWNGQTGQVYLMQMNGTNLTSGTLMYTEPDTDWRIAGAGDLDGDSKADLVWHNRKTGQVYGMQLNGSSIVNGAMLYTEPDTNWQIASIGKYGSDNKADLLWWNRSSGEAYLMPMDGLAPAGGTLLYRQADTNWRIEGETQWRDAVYGAGVTTTSESTSPPPTPPTTPTRPTAPANLTATAGDGQAIVRWQEVEGATSYNLYWSTTSGVSKSHHKIANVPNGSTLTMTNGVTYFLVVTAVNSSGESDVSNEVSVTPSGSNDSKVPTLISPKPGSYVNSYRPHFIWSPVPGATYYRLSYDGMNKVDVVTYAAAAITINDTCEVFDISLAEGGVVWKVAAYVNGAWQPYSQTCYFEIHILD